MIYILKFKNKQRCQTGTDILIEQLQKVQSDIRKLEKEKMDFDVPKFLDHKMQKIYVEYYILFLMVDVRQMFCAM